MSGLHALWAASVGWVRVIELSKGLHRKECGRQNCPVVATLECLALRLRPEVQKSPVQLSLQGVLAKSNVFLREIAGCHPSRKSLCIIGAGSLKLLGGHVREVVQAKSV